MNKTSLFLFTFFILISCNHRQSKIESDKDHSIVSYLYEQTYFDKYIIKLTNKKLSSEDLSFLKRFEFFYDGEIMGYNVFFLTYRGYKNNMGHNLNVFYYHPDSVSIEAYRVFEIDSSTYFKRYSYPKDLNSN